MSTQSDALAAAIQAVSDALRAAASDPDDQIRLLIDLATNGTAEATDATTAALCRRAALSSLGQALADYQPITYDDAIAVRDAVCVALDAEITLAGDIGDDASYAALRAIRAAAVELLTTLGAQLPRLVTITMPAQMPALALAYALYGDTTRVDELIARADPPHPGWMPVVFTALSD